MSCELALTALKSLLSNLAHYAFQQLRFAGVCPRVQSAPEIPYFVRWRMFRIHLLTEVACLTRSVFTSGSRTNARFPFF